MKHARGNKTFLQRLQQISRGYWESSILFAGVKSGVFNILSSGFKSAGKISKTLKTDERATEILLNALATLGFLIKRGNQYRNYLLTSRYLVDGKKDYRGNTLLHSLDMWNTWGMLSEVLYSGIPATDLVRKLGTDRERVEHFICAMDEHAQEPSEKIARLVRPKSIKKFLDVGGGPGTYCLALLKRNPEISATIVDLSLPLQIAKRLARERGLTRSLQFIEGDFLKVNFGNGYDLILMSHILHSNSPEDCEILIHKGYCALQKGGRLLIHDFILNEDKVSPPSAAIFAVNMLVNTQKGRTYTKMEITEWMKKAGFREIRCYVVTPASRAMVGGK
ncbi:MAG: methyltransferase [Proteobacteria bacterium]|nr:methyltransferase [Pseudomonadota bacterium]